jgi:hypothetical protein
LAAVGSLLAGRSGLPGAAFAGSGVAGRAGSADVFGAARRVVARVRDKGACLPSSSSATLLRGAALRGAGGESGALVAGERGRLRGGSLGGGGVSLMRTV